MSTKTRHADPTSQSAEWFVRNRGFVQPVQAFVESNPSASIRAIARATGVARLNVERALSALCITGRVQWDGGSL